MIILVLGEILWVAAHVFKRAAPGVREDMQARMGNGAKGVITLALIVSLVLMIWGYRSADFVAVYDPPLFLRHINNLMMLIAVALFGLGNSKSRLRRHIRHPMLWGVVVWAVAHLLANGDLASLLLFGGMGLWALVEMKLVNRAAHSYTPFAGGSLAGDIRLAVITCVVFAAIVLLHGWLGPWPLG
ncbi:hypothetical protein EKE94_17295 [Mesobaculum littorinae]|uniref:NnrU domain-containing protein n=1 Tax=Mesobaculum littorinae TaxID=2486419 RepID=A0A438AD86_9RHOB|nr:NnrU family protein [Mesobaculum littorinae]RVV96637.1 hypothetical protein EKE94_17295 [Mesobaculum littorinae]